MVEIGGKKMKADKEFYDTLRAEVRGMKDGVSTNYMMISKGVKPIEEDGIDELTVNQGPNNNKEMLALKEKIGSLQSQIKMLEEQNSNLTRKNKSLEEELSSAHTSITAGNTSEESTAKANEIETQVYISIEEIAKWAFEQNEDYGRAFKAMLIDLNISPSKELRELMDKYNQQYRQPSLQINTNKLFLQNKVEGNYVDVHENKEVQLNG
jgi:predicted RNase H-like nuclease (RuvC/YqgF family)